jgi:hypothetical protein
VHNSRNSTQIEYNLRASAVDRSGTSVFASSRFEARFFVFLANWASCRLETQCDDVPEE